MFEKIVVGYNGSSQSVDALALGGLLGGSMGSPLLIGLVYYQEPRWFGQTREYLRDQRERSHEILEPAVASLPSRITAEFTALGASSPARGLHDLAGEARADLVVIGSTHHGALGRVVIGAVGELLLAAAPFAVAVAPRGLSDQGRESASVVTAAFDGSPEARTALTNARALAERLGAQLRIVTAIARARGWHVAGPGEHGGHERVDRDRLEHEIGQGASEALGGMDAEHRFAEGDPAKALQEAAEGSDLLVVGSRGYGPVRHALLGSVSAQLMRTSSVPLLVMPRGGPHTAEDETPVGVTGSRKA